MVRVVGGVLLAVGLAMPVAVAQPERDGGEAHTVVVGGTEDILVRRLSAEFHAADLTVTPYAGTTPPTSDSLREAAQDVAAVAAVWIETSDARIAVSVEDLVTDKSLQRRFPLPPESAVDHGLVAIQAVELLRASLLEIRLRPEAQPPEPLLEKLDVPVEDAPPPSSPTNTETDQGPTPDRRWRAEFGMEGLWGQGGTGLRPQLLVGMQARIFDRLFAGLQASVPIGHDVLREGGQAAEVQLWRLGAELTYVGGDWLAPYAGLGGGVVILVAGGRATAPFVGTDDTASAFAVWTQVGLQWRPTEVVGLRAGLRVGVTVPELGVKFLEREVATWGLPFLAPAMSVAVAF